MDDASNDFNNQILTSLWDSKGNLVSSNSVFKRFYQSSNLSFSDLFKPGVSQSILKKVVTEREFEMDLHCPSIQGEQRMYCQFRMNQSTDGYRIAVRQNVLEDAGQGDQPLSSFDNTNGWQQRQHLMRKEIRSALSKGQFDLMLRYIKGISESWPKGIDMSMVWHHPSLGDVSMDEYMGLAEELGISELLAVFALEQACTSLKMFDRTNPIGSAIIHLTAHQLLSPSFLPSLQSVLKRKQISPNRVVLFISERELLMQRLTLDHTLMELRFLGVRLCTQCSLKSLYRFADDPALPISHIKLSIGSLIEQEGAELKLMKMISRSVNAMNKSGVQLIVADVQDPDYLALFSELGVGLFQTKFLY
jgi:EAL domain-containing protein (putative c-di-GMP-specific phosphodiesterase class I)